METIMVKESTFTLMDAITTGNGKMAKCMVQASTRGLVDTYTTEIGRTAQGMVTEY